MKNLIIGTVIAAVVLYLYGFLYWGGAIPYGEHVWKQSSDDSAAGLALVQHFPDKGTYFVPASTNAAEARVALYEQGPVAMVHMLAPQGRPEVDPSIMIQGFLVNLAFIIAVGLLMKHVVKALPSFGSRLMMAILAGLACTLLTDIGDIAWWTIDWQWKVYTGLYHFTAWVIVGAILAAFVRPNEAATA
ncbi:MAG: hypothetical protein KDA93_25180 [Planctomycetaceae bacterium]|nr:hypothetical protein [Planctomycetaceae bacterium]